MDFFNYLYRQLPAFRQTGMNVVEIFYKVNTFNKKRLFVNSLFQKFKSVWVTAQTLPLLYQHSPVFPK